MKIQQIVAREIYDSRGLPTVECDVILEDGFVSTASVPSGASRGAYEAYELRDGGTRLLGKGVRQAINNIRTLIAPVLVDQEINALLMDEKILQLDDSVNKERLGANATLAVSIALFRAHAHAEGVELYEFLAWMCGSQEVSLPMPFFNLINGGLHSGNGLRIQEFLAIPVGAQSISQSMELCSTLYYELRALLQQYERGIAVGDEGGFASYFEQDVEALDFLLEAMMRTDTKEEGLFGIGLDVAASQFWDPKTGKYNWNGKIMTNDELIDFYAAVAEQYPLYLIEDGLAEDDWEGWEKLVKAIGNSVHIVGDDLFTTNISRLTRGIQQGAASAVVIKPNQVGTVTQTLEAIMLCKRNNMGVIISHRSGETEDTFIADLAVGTMAGNIKAGACCRGERIAKYNRLLRIEDILLKELKET